MEASQRPDFIDIINSLLAAQKKNPILVRPQPCECTTNQIPGVTRVDPADEELEASITGLSTMTKTTTISEGSKDQPSTDESKPDISSSKKKYKNRSKNQFRNM